jgi:hypothetical protein
MGGHVTDRDIKNSHKILVGKPDGLTRLRRRWEDNTELYLKI